MRYSRLAFFLIALGNSLCYASTINVPGDQPTIQSAIAVANSGDIVLVAAGTYKENINFLGKAITVKSSGGARETIIDGGQVGPVATFATNEGPASVLSGFTLQNGTSTFDSQYAGGGIYISGASPSITNNTIQNNTACSDGAGIGVSFGSPRIQNNLIQGNGQAGCSGGPGGGGIALLGAGSAKIVGNRILGNGWGSNGGGITLFAAGAPTIINNVIATNNAEGQGGGIYIVNDSEALIVQNLFYKNVSNQGGGIYLSIPSGSTGPILVNNTIVGACCATEGSAVWAGGFDSQVQFFNNLMIGVFKQSAVFCDSTYSSTPPTFTNNDAYSPGGSGLLGTCSGQMGESGNISVDPAFVNKAWNNYRLQSTSLAINAGNNSAPDLPTKDLAGNPRVVGGEVDLGAYEFQ